MGVIQEKHSSGSGSGSGSGRYSSSGLVVVADIPPIPNISVPHICCSTIYPSVPYLNQNCDLIHFTTILVLPLQPTSHLYSQF